MTKSNYTKFECLPNELLFDIFEYIDVRDLYYGFWRLNKRINQLLRSLRNLSLTVERYEPELIVLFADQIHRLIVNMEQDVDFSRFPSLQTLILRQTTGNQLRQIRSELMPRLVYFSTSSIVELSLMPQLVQRLFSNGIPSIQYVELGHVHTPSLRTWFQSPALYSVSIHSTNPTIVPHILTSSPNLVYLRVDFLIGTIPIFHDSPSIDNHPLKQFILSDPCHKLSFNHVYILLAFISNVRKVYLNFLCKVPFIRFLQTLLNRLRYLKQFHCNIDDISNEKVIDIEVIRRIHPCFHRIQCSINDLNFRTFTTE